MIVLLHDCVIVLLHDCVIVLLHDHVIVLLHDHVIVLHDCVIVLLHNHVIVLLHDCPAAASFTKDIEHSPSRRLMPIDSSSHSGEGTPDVSVSSSDFVVMQSEDESRNQFTVGRRPTVVPP